MEEISSLQGREMRAQIMAAANEIHKHHVTVHSRDSSPWRDRSAALPRAVQSFVGKPACPASFKSFTCYVMHDKNNVVPEDSSLEDNYIS